MTNMHDDELEPYLWDRSGPVEADVARLEALLGRHGLGAARPPALPEAGARRRHALARLALAAGLAALALVGWRLLRPEAARGYAVRGLAARDFVREGEWLETGRGEAALLEIADLGTVDLGADARLRVERSTRDGHRLFLERGRISAAISAAPEVFQVGTPAGLSVDLGCLYELSVDPSGATGIAVAVGAVSFDGAGRHVIVPRDARTRATRERGPTSPVWADAADELLARVEVLDFDPAPGEELTARTLAELSSLTLWHLLQARSPAVRERAYDALVANAGAPAGLDRAKVLALDQAERERWLVELPWYEARFAPGRTR